MIVPHHRVFKPRDQHGPQHLVRGRARARAREDGPQHLVRGRGRARAREDGPQHLVRGRGRAS